MVHHSSSTNMATQLPLTPFPTKNPQNFAHFQAEKNQKDKKAAKYLPTNDEADCPDQQVITTEKTNILLRYLHQQWDKKRERVNAKRRESASDSETCIAKKRIRVTGRGDDDH